MKGNACRILNKYNNRDRNKFKRQYVIDDIYSVVIIRFARNKEQCYNRAALYDLSSLRPCASLIVSIYQNPDETVALCDCDNVVRGISCRQGTNFN